jgi:Domain of unknown function (DUF305)
MSCCNHSHGEQAVVEKSCGTKKCCKGKALLLFLAIFALGVLVGHTIDFPMPNMKMPSMQNGHDMKAMKDMPKNIYDSAMEKMHNDMMVKPTGNADIDFVNGMIPHHQGAIDMAKLVARKGTDPEIKKLAETIIEAQKKEISTMKTWLRANDSK